MSPWYKIIRLSKDKFQAEGFLVIFSKQSDQCDEKKLITLKKVFADDNLYQLIISGQEDTGGLRSLLSLPQMVLTSYHLGVTDNKACAASEALSLFGLKCMVSSFKIFKLEEEFNPLIFGNPLVENIRLISALDFKKWMGQCDHTFIANKKINPQVTVFNLDLSENELIKLSAEKCLALNPNELRAICQYFNKNEVREYRKSQGLPIHPTDVEIEIIAQTWSEHCKHKIFNAEIDYREDKIFQHKKFGDIKINGLFKTYIKKTTEEIIAKRKIPWAISLFTDNAGVVQYEEDVLACLKVETHNSPSALDPYGGALTGILGVNRDILGVGLGARPVANFDVFCLTPPHFPQIFEEGEMLVGVCHPQKIIEGVHKGVEDGGNKSGIPTVNGSYFFDADYLAKPLIFVGTLGFMPTVLSEGRRPAEKNIFPGDLIVMAGGKVGRDGIHGATFSSQELDTSLKTELSTVVQIGDPLTQKRLTDFILRARDLNLFRAITDNGAGGLSSSVGEMAQMSGGANLRIDFCPLKTDGLKPYEVVISESQERMTLAIDPLKFEELQKLAKLCAVEISCLGEFTDTQYFSVFYQDEQLASLPLAFLHQPPELKLKAVFKNQNFRSLFRKQIKKEIVKFENGFISLALKTLLNDPNIASKEEWVRRYDHEVGAKTVIKPYASEFNSPNGAGGIKSKEVVYLLGHGLAPKWSLLDPYLMAIRSVDEAIRNIVAAGADPEMISILDNFCTPDPVSSPKNSQGEWQLARLVRANIGLQEVATAYGTPLISGKDSMKNDFSGKNLAGELVKHSVLPTLLVTALGKTQEEFMNKGSFINQDDLVVMIGPGISKNTFVLSSLEENMQTPRNFESFEDLYQIDLKENMNCFKAIYELHKLEVFSSLSDVNEDGALVNLFELLMGSKVGAKLTIDKNKQDLFKLFFASSLATFIGTIGAKKLNIVQDICLSFQIPFLLLGQIQKSYQLDVESSKIAEKINLSELENIYRKAFTPGDK